MRDADGHLRRTWKPGHAARLNAYLEDYANVADGLLALYEATFDPRWLSASVELAEVILAEFADRDNGGFFDTSTGHEQLITRPKDIFDNATPSGNSVAADVLLRLGAAHRPLRRSGRRPRASLRPLSEAMARYPLGFARALNALDFSLDTPQEVAIVGDKDAEDTRALRRAVFEPFVPEQGSRRRGRARFRCWKAASHATARPPPTCANTTCARRRRATPPCCASYSI